MRCSSPHILQAFVVYRRDHRRRRSFWRCSTNLARGTLAFVISATWHATRAGDGIAAAWMRPAGERVSAAGRLSAAR